MTQSTTPDFRDEEPTWVRYAMCTERAFDKYYEVTIHLGDDGLFYLQKRWGRRPDTGAGQIKVEPYHTLGGATSAANLMLDEKVRKGYEVVNRPEGAGSKVERDDGQD